MHVNADDPGPYYHDFTWLGLPTGQLSPMHEANQRAKAPVIAAYILLSLARLGSRGVADATVAELFCADGFYAMFAARFGAARVVGYDNDREGHLASAQRMRDRLGLGQVRFEQTAVEAIPESERYDVVINAGGLYHVDDPVSVLDRSYAMARHFLIVQNVVSLATDDPDYFERPAPGLDWGNRFSRQSFDALVRARGWNIVAADFNVLQGNARPEDRGSLYYLIGK